MCAEGISMTLQELSKHLKLNEKLQQDIEILESLRARATSPATSNLTGMPHASGVNDKVAFFVTEIEDMSRQVERLQQEVDAERVLVEEFIGNIKDDRTRTIGRLRFLHCMSWKEVAYIMGRSYTEESVRKRFYKFMKDYQRVEL